MSKRRINIQQARNIKKNQASYQSNNTNTAVEEGLVITRGKKKAIVENKQGLNISAFIRPNIDSLIAGDKILFQIEKEGTNVIISRYPRESILTRPDKQGKLRPVAANITQIMVVVAPKPELSWTLLDSYLIMGEHLNLKICIILNKTDIPCENISNELLNIYKPLGYDILFTSDKTQTKQNLLKQALQSHSSVFVGQSGVGKSSLIARLIPELKNIKTAKISTISELGCHTTNSSMLYHLPSGGCIIDSPGIRELGLGHISLTNLAQGYREFKPYLNNCKFRNCTHQATPGCAIIQALSSGFLTEKRYQRFITLSKEFKLI